MQTVSSRSDLSNRRIYHCPILYTQPTTHQRPSAVRVASVAIIVEQGEFIFRLNESASIAIHQYETEPLTLQIPSSLVMDLRRYALVDGNNRPQSGITFLTAYLDPQVTEPGETPSDGELVFRSIVSLDGDVIHQIHEQILDHPYCRAIATSHHWLINQLMDRLRLSVTGRVEWVFKRVPPVVVTATVAFNLSALLSDPIAALRWIGLSCFSFLLPKFQKPVVNFFWRSLISPNSWFWKLMKPIISRFVK